MKYLAFGKNKDEGITGPWQIFAVENTKDARIYSGFYTLPGNMDNSRIYQVSGLEGDIILKDELSPGTPAYNKVQKWIGKRNILSTESAQCRVTEEDVLAMLKGTYLEGPLWPDTALLAYIQVPPMAIPPHVLDQPNQDDQQDH